MKNISLKLPANAENIRYLHSLCKKLDDVAQKITVSQADLTTGQPQLVTVSDFEVGELWIEALIDVYYSKNTPQYRTTALKIERPGMEPVYQICKDVQKKPKLKTLLQRTLDSSTYHRAWIDTLIKPGLRVSIRDLYDDETGQRKILEQHLPRVISPYRFYEFMLNRNAEPDSENETKADFLRRGRDLLIEFLKTDIQALHWHQLQIYKMKVGASTELVTFRSTQVCFDGVMIADFAPAEEAYQQFHKLSPEQFKDWFESDSGRFYNLGE